MEKLYVQMLGGLSIGTEDTKISDRDSRSRKIWILLAYMIYHRHRIVEQEELINLLWGEDERGENPTGALKTMLHRARSVLDKLWFKAGRDLILNQNGGYVWNAGAPSVVDIDEFDELCRKEMIDKEEQLKRGFRILQLYRGDFLAHMSSESWVIPIAAYYHNCYIQSLLKVLPVLMEQQRYRDVAEFCQIASTVEPFHEEIHCYLMKALYKLGDQKGAASIYNKLCKCLFSNFGITPAEQTRMLYYEIIKTDNDRAVPIEVIMEQLREEHPKDGALICGYDFFRVLYQSMARFMVRSGIATHIVLVSVTGKDGEEISGKKVERTMRKLEEQIRFSLRRGDSAAKCSVSQYILMLPQSNYENSCMVCERIVKAYYRRHSHSDTNIQYAVYPMQPDEGSFQLINRGKSKTD